MRDGQASSIATDGESTRDRRVVSLSAGASHTVALLSDGTVCSWGRGEDGQLGLGSADEQHEPTEVTSLGDQEVTAIACGADHTTAFSDGKLIVWSWGWGDFGRLGHGNSTDLFHPHPVRTLCDLPIRQIACGDCHCLAVTGEGEVYSWGRNQNGQLGLGNTEDSLLPRKITAFEGTAIRAVAAGAEHTSAVSCDGALFGWGWGRYGNLGLGDRRDRAEPERVTAVESERMCLVACGWRHTICVNEDGQIFTFGWSKYGQLGHGDFADHLTPSPVEALQSRVTVAISGGWRHSVALDGEGKVYVWGWNKFGQVGVGNNEDQNSPRLIESLTEPVSQVSCGWRHTVALTQSGNVFSWGRGTSGQLGHGDTVDRSLPHRLDALSADAGACRHIATASDAVSSAAPSAAGATLVSPSERYAVVPDERDQSRSCGGSDATLSDASVPEADMKRFRAT